MIIATLWIEREEPTKHDAFGQPLKGKTTRERVAPVKLMFDSQHTTVRTDSAGSHGHASEGVANIVLLASPKSLIGINDILIVLGQRVHVVGKHPRMRVNGQHDHNEIHCEIWR